MRQYAAVITAERYIYIGETGKRLEVRAREPLGEKSYLGQHTIRTGHRPVTLNIFKILSSGFKLEIGR